MVLDNSSGDSVCASPSLHADRCGSFVEPKAEYVVDFLLLLSVTRLTKFTSSFCSLLLCWLWPLAIIGPGR